LLVRGQALTELCDLFWHVHQRLSSVYSPVGVTHVGDMLTPPPPAGSRGASHPRSDGLGPADTPAADGAALAVAPGVRQAVVESLVPTTCAGALHYNAIPIRAGDVAGGFRSAESRSPGILAGVFPTAVHRGHWPGDTVVAFSARAASDCVCSRPEQVRKSRPGHGGETDFRGQVSSPVRVVRLVI
jgi:hypothetical protein